MSPETSSKQATHKQTQQKLLALEARLDALLRDHQRLQRMAAAHDDERLEWQAERQKLQERHQQARERLDYVIARLKEFEQA
ncbi:MAG: hypothetical protein WED11_03455 [Natronospirillum sp.]